MYKKILIATDGSELAGHAVQHGLQLAKSVGSPVVFVTVSENWPALQMASDIERGKLDAIQVYEDAAADSAREVLASAAALAASMDVDSEGRHVKDSKPAKGIMDTAELEECDLIIMASHGHRGLQKMLVGSQTAEVIALSKLPVLILR